MQNPKLISKQLCLCTVLLAIFISLPIDTHGMKKGFVWKPKELQTQEENLPNDSNGAKNEKEEPQKDADLEGEKEPVTVQKSPHAANQNNKRPAKKRGRNRKKKSPQYTKNVGNKKEDTVSEIWDPAYSTELIALLNKQKIKPSNISTKAIESASIAHLKLLTPCADKITKLTLVHVVPPIKDNDIQYLIEHFPNLTELQLLVCYKFRDSSLINMARGYPNLTKLTLLGCIKITDNGVIDLAKNCTKLTELRLQGLLLPGLMNISSAGVEAIATHCPDLTQLDLAGCDKITDSAVLALSIRCPNFTYLGLERCSKITDEGLGHLSNLEKLQVLNLERCYEITDKSIIELAKICPDLTRLYLRDTQVTDTGLRCLGELSKLQHLQLPKGKTLRGKQVKHYLDSLHQ